jgi:hypothetical protein
MTKSSANSDNNKTQNTIDLDLPVVGGSVKKISFKQLIILIFVLSFLTTVMYALYSYGDKSSTSYILFNPESKGDLAKARQQQKLVMKLIKKWNSVSSMKELTGEISEIRTEISFLLEQYDNYNYSNWNIQQKLTYLYHLAELRIIYTDVYRKSKQVYLAIRDLETAQNLVRDQTKLSESDISFMDKNRMALRFSRSLLNADIFAYLSTGLKETKDSAKAKLENLGGCSFLTLKKVYHNDIFDALDCKKAKI